MKNVFLLFTFLFAVSAQANHTCYARYGSPSSEGAAPCWQGLDLNLSPENLRAVKVLSENFACADTKLTLTVSIQGSDSFRAMLSNGKHSTWAVYDLVDQGKVWLGMNSREQGFAEVSCLKK